MTGLSPPGVVLAPAVASLPGARVHLNASQAIANGGIISWEAADYDSNGFWSAGDPTKLTVPAGLGGVYLIGFATDVSSDQTLSSWVSWNIEASDRPDALCGIFTDPVNTPNPLVSMSNTWKTVAGTYFSVKQFQNQAGNVSPSGNNDTCLWIVRLSP